MTEKQTHLEELRAESADVAELIEDNEEVVRTCTGNCSACPHDKINTCMN